MTLDEHLKSIREDCAHSNWSEDSVSLYKCRQNAFIKSIYGPILELMTNQKLTSEQICESYLCTGSGRFSKTYIKIDNALKGSDIDPTYYVGQVILIETYASLKNISEKTACKELSTDGTLLTYDLLFEDRYKILLNNLLNHANQSNNSKKNQASQLENISA